MTDILSIKPTLRTLVVKHPADGMPVGLEIDYRSLDSEEVQAVERVLKTKSLRNGRNTPSLERLEDAEYAILHAVVADWRWSNGMTLGDDPSPKVTRENTEKLFRSAPWIKKQLNAEIGDETGFFSSAQSSSSKA